MLSKGSRTFRTDVNFIYDPTMPRVEAKCPECSHDEAIYILTPDTGESKLLTKMICARITSNTNTATCGHIWDLSQEILLDKISANRQ